jgi:hypothetical protein
VDRVLDIIRATRIYRPLDMAAFDPVYEGAGAVFQVWVNPTRDHVRAWYEVVRAWGAAEQAKQAWLDEKGATRKAELEAAFTEAVDTALALQDAWFAQMWQGMSVEEVVQLRDALSDAEWQWLSDRTTRMPGEFREEKVKNSRGG